MATGKLLPRIKRELQILESDLPQGIICYPIDDSCTRFAAQIKGSKDTPYEDGAFKIDIQVTARYPIEPPKVQFVTPIYHPNIDSSGRICLDALKMPPAGSWRPSLNISTVLISLSVLMGDPNPDDPLDVDIAKEYKENRPLFLHKARESTLKHAVDATETSTLSLDHHPTEPTITTTTTATSSSSSSASSSSSTVLPPVVPSSSSPGDAHKPDGTIETATSLTIPAASRLSLSKNKSLFRSHPARLTAPLVVKTPSNDVTPRSANEAGQVQTNDVVYTLSDTAKSADMAMMVKTGDKKSERRQAAEAEMETEMRAEQGAEPRAEPGAEPGAELEIEMEVETKTEATKTEAETKTEVEAETETETETEAEAEAEAETEAKATKRDNESPGHYAVVANLDDDKENVRLHGAEESLNKDKENVGLRSVETNSDKSRKNVRLDAVKTNLDRDKENIGLGAVETNLLKDKENVELHAIETSFDNDKNVNLHTPETRVVVPTNKIAAPPEQGAMAVTALQETAPLATVSDRKRRMLMLKRKEAGTVTEGDEEGVRVKKLRQDE